MFGTKAEKELILSLMYTNLTSAITSVMYVKPSPSTNVHLFALAPAASSFFGQFCCHAARSLWTSKPFSTQVYKGEAGECCYRSSPVVAWALV